MEDWFLLEDLSLAIKIARGLYNALSLTSPPQVLELKIKDSHDSKTWVGEVRPDALERHMTLIFLITDTAIKSISIGNCVYGRVLIEK
jgi:hypothetical protein